MSLWYKLDGHTPVPCGMMDAAVRFDDSDSRRVHYTELADGVSVSTVFLAFDHRHGDGPPLLFETMIFGGEFDEQQWRYSTWNEAAEGHAHAVRLACGEAKE